MAATRRLEKELHDIRASNLRVFRDINVDGANVYQWMGLIVPESAPYNRGAFRIRIDFPAAYPFKPPEIKFLTKIYHPNINEKGEVSPMILSPLNWRTATKTDQVIQALVSLVSNPDPEHPLRPDLAKEYTEDREKFMENAEEFTKKFGEKRPSD